MKAAASEASSKQIWLENALTALRDSGPVGQASVEYIRDRRIPLGFSRQKSTGATWFDWRRLRHSILLNGDYADRRPDDAHLFVLLAHEAKHLEQGLAEALSVRGELAAWQLQYDVLAQSLARPAGPLWQELRALDPDSRSDVERAQPLMKQIGGPGYHVDWMPIWPLPAEIAYRFKKMMRRFSDSG